ncbi:S8 family peptidase [Jidongwangia harbinensis]|uniref:S8 family peptidase n=1 Tax=Jidongwangia harbinensis TaxID=2878561 RepID=UPI001CD969D8|nr:S8 family peptidase [Jidongwangia harbinensis]MCA2213733.1 S8 family peptidase [Jidongwangia harbinensis]
MIRTNGRSRTARLVLTAGVAAAAAVTGAAGSASAGTPRALPTGTVLNAGAPGAIGDSYIVTFRPGSDAAGRVTSASTRLAQRYGGAVAGVYRTAMQGFHVRMTAAAARRLAADPAVAAVEQDARVRIDGVQAGPAWGLDRIDQATLPLSTSYTYRPAANVTAYVLDTGIRIGHTEFGGRARNGYDFIDSDPVANDCNGHGTHVAGTIGGRTYGVAKDVRLVGVRVLDCRGSGSYSTIIAGVDWVTRNATRPAVANMSLGGGGSKALDDAVRRSIAAGITYAVAAGNEARDACTQSPARTPEAITVGATDSTDARAAFSNHGRCLDLFAPGARIGSASSKSDTGVVLMSGTSMASPHVAGVAALVLGAHPGYAPKAVRDAVVANAVPNRVVRRGADSPNRLLCSAWLNRVPASARR